METNDSIIKKKICDISTFIGQSPFVNASGCLCATRNMLAVLETGKPAGICTKSCTLLPRSGNPEPRYWEHPDGLFTLNSMGLPNLGVDYYLNYFTETLFNGWKCISLAVMSLKETRDMLNRILTNHPVVDAIEFNLSCPNLEGKEIVAYDKTALGKLLIELEHTCSELESNNSRMPKYGIKLPPYFQIADYLEIARLINPSWISFIHTVNSIPNALVIDISREETVIHPKQGFGGLGGEIIKPIALANVRGFWQAFQQLGGKWPQIHIIGCGGISKGEDVFEMLLAGASAVSIGSQLMIEGPKCISRLTSELIEIMEDKNYKNIKDFQGRLKVTAPLT